MALICNLGKDPEVKKTGDSQAASFNIAVNEHFTDKGGDKQKRTHWFRIVAYDRLAQISQQYLKAGSKVAVRGQLTNRTWEKNGQKHSIVEIVAREIELLGGNSNGQGGRSSGREDEDIPF